MKNHLGSYECKLCLTLHNNEVSETVISMKVVRELELLPGESKENNLSEELLFLGCESTNFA